VLRKDVKNNTITVGTENDENLFRSQCSLRDINLLVDVLPKNCSAQIRYRQAPQSCILDA
jgi:tRNA U34 2-thiouridine synthase MnmA/TrmU